MRYFRCFVFWLAMALVFAQCARKSNPNAPPDMRSQFTALGPVLQSLLHSQTELPVYYYTPDSLFLMDILGSNGHPIHLMAAEEQINRLGAMPEYTGNHSSFIVLAPAGLKVGTTPPGSIVFDRPLLRLTPEYFTTLLTHSVSALPTGGRVIIVQTKSQSSADQKQIVRLQEQVAFSRAMIDSSHSQVFNLLIFEK